MPKLILIDPGHGGSDPGAISKDKKIREKDLALGLSLAMKEELEKQGYLVILTRCTDKYVLPDTRTSLVKKVKPSLVISNHINAGGGQGAEIIKSKYDNTTLSSLLEKSFVQIGLTFRKVYTKASSSNPANDYYFMLRNTRPIQSVIVEYGFIDSEKDLSRLKNKELMDRLIKNMVSKIDEYLGGC